MARRSGLPVTTHLRITATQTLYRTWSMSATIEGGGASVGVRLAVEPGSGRWSPHQPVGRAHGLAFSRVTPAARRSRPATLRARGLGGPHCWLSHGRSGCSRSGCVPLPMIRPQSLPCGRPTGFSSASVSGPSSPAADQDWDNQQQEPATQEYPLDSVHVSAPSNVQPRLTSLMLRVQEARLVCGNRVSNWGHRCHCRQEQPLVQPLVLVKW
jgi:hypothetical protein